MHELTAIDIVALMSLWLVSTSIVINLITQITKRKLAFVGKVWVMILWSGILYILMKVIF